jgi:hypothetical protein
MSVHALYPPLCNVWSAGLVTINTFIFRIVMSYSWIDRYFNVDFYPEGGDNRLHRHGVTCEKTEMLNCKDRAS